MADSEETQRVAVHLEEKLYKKLVREATRRKVEREDGASISGVIRDALEAYFSRKKKAA